jgi:hypothetical protein
MTQPANPSATSAVLVRRHAVVVRNISMDGCLLEMATPLAAGAVGAIEIDVDGVTCVEMFRVARLDERAPRVPAFDVAVEFLPVAPAGERSVRGFVARVERERMTGAGTKSGAPLTLVPRTPTGGSER